MLFQDLLLLDLAFDELLGRHFCLHVSLSELLVVQLFVVDFKQSLVLDDLALGFREIRGEL